MNENQKLYENLAYYPQPISLDEESGKISVQGTNAFQQNMNNENLQFQQQDSTLQNTQNSQINGQHNANSQQTGGQHNAFGGMNMQSLFSMLNAGGASNEMLSSMLSGSNKIGANQNPLMAQAFSKMLNTKKSDSSAASSSFAPTSFEEM